MCLLVSRSSTLTTADVAKMLGVSENTVRRWEREDRIPRVRRDTNGRRRTCLTFACL